MKTKTAHDWEEILLNEPLDNYTSVIQQIMAESRKAALEEAAEKLSYVSGLDADEAILFLDKRAELLQLANKIDATML